MHSLYSQILIVGVGNERRPSRHPGAMMYWRHGFRNIVDHSGGFVRENTSQVASLQWLLSSIHAIPLFSSCGVAIPRKTLTKAMTMRSTRRYRFTACTFLHSCKQTITQWLRCQRAVAGPATMALIKIPINGIQDSHPAAPVLSEETPPCGMPKSAGSPRV